MEDNLGLNVSGQIAIQQSGYLLIKNTTTHNPLEIGWKKRFCILKDGFFLWYPSNSQALFDRPPKGILPLNMAYTASTEEDKSGCTFEIMHPEIFHAEFLFKAPNKVDAAQWIDALETAKKANWENAMLGAALIDSMKSQGTKKEEEKKKAVKELEEKLEKLKKANRDKMRILERERKQMEKFEAEIKAADELAGEAAAEAKNIQLAIEQEEQLFKEAATKKEQLQQKLSMATMALRRLEKSLELEFSNRKAEAFEHVNVEKNVNALKSFFEETFDAHRRKQSKFVGKKLKVIQQTLRRTKKKRDSLY
mmetsp:Transcript_23719/g.38090  ORF Transcript_23719/g.38090 Transcript_23719/m.38090 type:complete len:308 (+) Transcript_23719:1-924(+)